MMVGQSILAIITYSIAAILYLSLLVLVVNSWHEKRVSRRLLTALIGNAAWAALHAYDAYNPYLSINALYLLEYTRDSLWIVFLLGLLNTGQIKRFSRQTTYWIYVLCTAVVTLGLVHEISNFQGLSFGRMNLLVAGKFVLIFTGLFLVEQVYRNTIERHKRSIKPLCLALGGLFIFDLYLFSNAVLFGRIDLDVWIARGLIVALVVPLIAISIKRSSSFSMEIFVSRQVVFYTATFFGAGIYLIAIATASYYLRAHGGGYGAVAQIVFLFGAIIVLFFIVSSGNIRSLIMVFLGKHFYKNKYDYREEWMRFIRNLSNIEIDDDIRVRVIQSIADIVASTGGTLWLKQEGQGYFCKTCWNVPTIQSIEPLDGELASFLGRRDWVIDIDEYNKDPFQYENLRLPDWLHEHHMAWLVIPLRYQQDLIGFLILQRSPVPREINWEDRDLLKTAGRQASSYLALLSITEKLDELHRFEAFNRLSAYVVHDLKNLVAQLDLVVSNASRHRDNPVFMDDAIKTVENAVTKMTRLLNQLRKGRFEKQSLDKVLLNEVLMEAVKQREVDRPKPKLSMINMPVYVLAEKNRLVLVLEHLIQNAQEATDNNGNVSIKLEATGESAVITISDTGVGMDSSFIRDRLFKPFETTKGNAGMGIGVYESREFIGNIGGRMDVESQIGQGTVFTIHIPTQQLMI